MKDWRIASFLYFRPTTKISLLVYFFWIVFAICTTIKHSFYSEIIPKRNTSIKSYFPELYGDVYESDHKEYFETCDNRSGSIIAVSIIIWIRGSFTLYSTLMKRKNIGYIEMKDFSGTKEKVFIKKEVIEYMKKRNKKNFNWERIENSVPFCIKVYEIILTAVLLATFIGVIVSLKISQILQLSALSLINLYYISGPFIVAFIIFSCIYNIKNLSDRKIPILSFISLEDLVYACCILLMAISLSFLDEILPLIKEATTIEMLTEKIIYAPYVNFILFNLVFCGICICFIMEFNKKKLSVTVGAWILILIVSLLFKFYPEIGETRINEYVLHILLSLILLSIVILFVPSSMEEKIMKILFLVGVGISFLVSWYYLLPHVPRKYLIFIAFIILIIWLILIRKKLKTPFSH